MKTFFALLFLIIPPTISIFVVKGVEYKNNLEFRDALIKNDPELSEDKLSKITLQAVCQNQELASQLSDVCSTVEKLTWMKITAFLLIFFSIVLVGFIWIAGVLSKLSRYILLLLFAPGLYLTALSVVIFVVANALLLVGCIYYGESALIGRIHVGIMAGIAIGALYAAILIVKSTLMALRKASTTVIGKQILKKDQPGIWRFVEDLAKKIGALSPQNMVVGLDPNFYVTEANVTCLDDKLSGRTIYLSLPLCRILSKDELQAVIGHELGHYKGLDTKFSLWFYPIYKGLVDSLVPLEGESESGSLTLAVLPARILLGIFLSSFSEAENKISRERELMADKVAVEVGGIDNMASALVKVHAFSAYWSGMIELMKKTLCEGNFLINASELYEKVIRENAKDEALVGIDAECMTHPTDSHPPLKTRLDAMKTSVAAVKNAALNIKPDSASIQLLIDHEKLEKEISELKQAIMVKTGEAQLPSDEGAEQGVRPQN